MRRGILLAASIVFCGLAVSASGSAAQVTARWVVRDLGPCGSSCPVGDMPTLAINEKGQVVGTSGKTAFLWQNGKLRNLGTLGGTWSAAVGINDRGQVIGSADTKGKDENGELISRAFLWQNGKMRDLGTLAGDTHSETVAINERGQVVGCSSGDPVLEFDTTVIPCAVGTAVVWEGGKIRDLGMLPGHADSHPVAVNANGWIIGQSSPGTRGGGAEAVLWRDGRIASLGKLGGNWTQADDISDRNQIVGSGSDRGTNGKAFLWTNGAMRVIARAGDFESFGQLAIDNRGRVAGSTIGSPAGRVFVWTSGTTRFVGRGYVRAVNERGQVVGSTDVEIGAPRLWENGKTVKLPLLPGHEAGWAEALNERDQIVGYSGKVLYEHGDYLSGRIVLWARQG